MRRSRSKAWTELWPFKICSFLLWMGIKGQKCTIGLDFFFLKKSWKGIILMKCVHSWYERVHMRKIGSRSKAWTELSPFEIYVYYNVTRLLLYLFLTLNVLYSTIVGYFQRAITLFLTGGNHCPFDILQTRERYICLWKETFLVQIAKECPG